MRFTSRTIVRRLFTIVATSAIATAIAVMVPATGRAQDNGLFLNIQPPGQDGYLDSAAASVFFGTGVLPPNFDDQLLMYSDLIRASPGLVDEDLTAYFKPAPIAPSGNPPGPKDFMLPDDPRITITRDDFGVPHIETRGRRRMWTGVGWAMTADKLFAMDLVRRAGRGRLAEALGASPLVDADLLAFALGQDESIYQFAGYDDADLQEQLEATLSEFGSKAKRVEKDLDAFLTGVNGFIDWVNADPGPRAPIESIALGLIPVEPFTRRDILSVATVLEQLFGAGGGGEHRNAILLQKLRAALGDNDGQALFDDLRHAEEPEASTTTALSFPYLIQGGSVDPAAVALPDVGSILSPPMIQIIGPLPAMVAGLQLDGDNGLRSNEYHPSMSNFLAITAEHAEGGHPIAVMGPQVAYFIPSLLTEISFDSGRMQARGMAVTGTPFVVLGRGPSYAWSATAGGSDMVDVRAELLCEPDTSPPSIMSKHYVFNGVCTPMFERIDEWCIGSTAFCTINGNNARAVVQRSGHGLVFARATVSGAPVALVKQRATFKREGQNALAFTRINQRGTTRFKRFEKHARLIPGSFNWLYVNQKELGYVHTGRFPVRADGVDFELPSWGTGEWEWEGFIHHKQRPHEVDPAKGFFTSWNNKPAREWRAADANYSFGTVYRVDSLDDRVEAEIELGAPISVARMVEMMAEAATVDLRGSQILPHALAMIGSEAPLDPVLTILSDWVASGAQRLDRDGNGAYDHTCAVAIMNEWWDRMIDATIGPQIGPFESDIPMGRDNRPGPLGSAYQSGYYGFVQKVIRMAAGDAVEAPFAVLRCADGTTAGCRAALVASLADSVTALTAEFASANPVDWSADPSEDQIEFTPFGIATVDPIPWQNRPTFQQVVQVESK